MNIDIGIDLGTANIIIYLSGQGVVLNEPSVVAVNENYEVVAIGEEAKTMVGRTHNNIKTIRPLREGVISDFVITRKMIKHFIKKIIGVHFFKTKPRIAICVPSNVTEVEKRAVEDVARQAGARQVYVIEEPIAAAIGAGIDISQPVGTMIVDIGGGTTDIAVISLNGTVVSDSVKIAGDVLNEAITNFIKKDRQILIGERTAEIIKIEVGNAHESIPNKYLEIRGRDLVFGLPKTTVVSSEEIRECLLEYLAHIITCCRQVLEKTPPELISDIVNRGVVLTGGGGLLPGLDILLSEKLGVNVLVAEQSLYCVAVGTGKYLEYIVNSKNHKIFE